MLFFILGFALSILCVPIFRQLGAIQWIRRRNTPFIVLLPLLLLVTTLPVLFAFESDTLGSEFETRLVSLATGIIAGLAAYSAYLLVTRNATQGQETESKRSKEGTAATLPTSHPTGTHLALKTIMFGVVFLLGLLLFSSFLPYIDKTLRSISKLEVGLFKIETLPNDLAEYSESLTTVVAPSISPELLARQRITAFHAYSERPSSDARFCYYSKLTRRSADDAEQAVKTCIGLNGESSRNAAFLRFYLEYLDPTIDKHTHDLTTRNVSTNSIRVGLGPITEAVIDITRLINCKHSSAETDINPDSCPNKSSGDLIARLNAIKSEVPRPECKDDRDCDMTTEWLNRQGDNVLDFERLHLVSQSDWMHHLASNLLALYGDSATGFKLLYEYDTYINRGDTRRNPSQTTNSRFALSVFASTLLNSNSSIRTTFALDAHASAEKLYSNALRVWYWCKEGATGDTSICRHDDPYAAPASATVKPPDNKPIDFCKTDFPTDDPNWRPLKDCIRRDLQRAIEGLEANKENAANAIISEEKIGDDELRNAEILASSSLWLLLDRNDELFGRGLGKLQRLKGFNVIDAVDRYGSVVLGSQVLSGGIALPRFNLLTWGSLRFETVGAVLLTGGIIRKDANLASCGAYVLSRLRKIIDSSLGQYLGICGNTLASNDCSLADDILNLNGQSDRLAGRIRLAGNKWPALVKPVVERPTCEKMGEGLERLWPETS